MCISFFKRYCYFPLFILTILITYAILFLGYLFLSDTSMFTTFLMALAKYDLNTIILGIIAIVIAIITLCMELRKRDKEKAENQIKLIGGLIAEIDILSAERSDIFNEGKPTKGNLIWHKEAILSNNIISLDHPIHKIGLDKYLTGFDKSILKILDISKLSRTLSYLNNKTDEINYIQKIRDKTLNEITSELEKVTGRNDKSKKEAKEEDIKNLVNKIRNKNIEVYKKLGILESINNVVEESISICYKTKGELIKQIEDLLNQRRRLN